MARASSRSGGVTLPPAEELKRLKISPEVAWYLLARDIPLPDCIPLVKTPEPRYLEGARFDPDKVDKVLRGFGQLRHTKGQWAGRPLKPDPWQVAHIIAPIFGWVRWSDDADAWVRIINDSTVDVPRKNGKTTVAGGVAITLTCGDGESGAEVYAAAGGKDQARFCFDPVKALAQKSPMLKPFVKPMQSRIVHVPSASYFAVISKIADLMHGANVHGAIIDELHVHKSPDLVETLETGTGSRTQPLIFKITTADDSRQTTIYARNRQRIEQLAARVYSDPSTYGVIFAAEPSDDPFAETTWRKANPGYGISPTRSYMERAAAKAQQSPADLAKFLRLHLGIRTKQATKYLDLGAWDRNSGKPLNDEVLAGRACFGGMDLSSTSDLTSVAWVFPYLKKRGMNVLWRHWAPAASLEALNRRTSGAADVWVRQGYLTLTPGEVIDYEYVRMQINRDREVFDVKALAYDPWNSSQLVNDLLADEAPMVTWRQGFASMSAPTKELQRLILAGQEKTPLVRHGGNPLARWQVDNFAVAMDPAGNVKPDKASAGDKIDGMVALIMALGVSGNTVEETDESFESYFGSGRRGDLPGDGPGPGPRDDGEPRRSGAPRRGSRGYAAL